MSDPNQPDFVASGAAERVGLDSAQQHRVIDFLHEHPTDIGPYHIVGVVGHGGMGIVYKAEQRTPVRRIVALKLIKLGMDTRDVIARFESERQALAMMNHPNVARVFDAGATDRGRPYFVMEYVAGEPITRFCDRHEYSVPERLELFMQACEAVQHAHQKAIIHRDLKPTNILVMLEDGAPRVKVIDFGVAKATARPLTERTLFTETGRLLGTPEYMSPEQAERAGADVDTRTDVYSLGVVLYELLTGALPFDPQTLRGAGIDEIHRLIRDVEPPRPSTRLSSLGKDAAQSVARHRRAEVEPLARQLRSELEWIPLKAMRKERAQRYATAAELAADIRNYLERRPLRAGPESTTYRLRKFLRRNKAGVAASAAMVLLLMSGIAATTWQAIRATRAERATRAALAQVEAKSREAEARHHEAQAVAEFLSEYVLAGATPERLPDKTVRDTIVRVMLDPAAEAIGDVMRRSPLVEAAVRNTLADCYTRLGRADRALPHATFALDTRRRLLGDEHVLTIESVNTMALLLRQQGKYADAEQQLRATLATAQRTLGDDHAQTLETRISLGELLLGRAKFAEAEPLLRRALAQERAARNRPNVVVGVMQYQGLALMLMDRLEEAEALFREALDLARREFGELDRRPMAAANHLAQCLERRGRFADAKPLMLESLRIARSVLGEDHPDAIVLYNNLGSLHKKMGEFDEAERIYREVADAMARVVGEEHPNALTGLSNLASLLSDRGRYAEAEPLLVRVLAGRRRGLGDDHAQTIESIFAVGNVLAKQGRHAEAEPLFDELYRRCGTTNAMGAARVASFMGEWGPCLVALGRFADAEAPLLEAHRRLSAAGQQHSQVMSRVLGSLEVVCKQAGRDEDAATWHAELESLLATTRAATRPAPPVHP